MAAAEVFPDHRAAAKKALGVDGHTMLSAETKDRITAVAQALADAETRGENRQHGRIRVLRLLEYVYPDAEAMVADLGHWQIQSQRRMGGTRITSVVLPPEVLG